MGRSTIALLALLSPTLLQAQMLSTEAQALRAKALAEGSVEIHVVTRALAQSKGAGMTSQRKVQIVRDQFKIVTLLVERNLVVGNEIRVEQDGSFSMRVLPQAIDSLAASEDVAEIRGNR